MDPSIISGVYTPQIIDGHGSVNYLGGGQAWQVRPGSVVSSVPFLLVVFFASVYPLRCSLALCHFAYCAPLSHSFWFWSETLRFATEP